MESNIKGTNAKAEATTIPVFKNKRKKRHKPPETNS